MLWFLPPVLVLVQCCKITSCQIYQDMLHVSASVRESYELLLVEALVFNIGYKFVILTFY